MQSLLCRKDFPVADLRRDFGGFSTYLSTYVFPGVGGYTYMKL
jgi:hypothetical protein